VVLFQRVQNAGGDVGSRTDGTRFTDCQEVPFGDGVRDVVDASLQFHRITYAQLPPDVVSQHGVKLLRELYILAVNVLQRVFKA